MTEVEYIPAPEPEVAVHRLEHVELTFKDYQKAKAKLNFRNASKEDNERQGYVHDFT